MASTSRPPSLIAYPSRELMQELDDVKNLLQMTLDETRAWCNEVESRCSVSAEVAREPEPSAQQSVRDSQGQVANDPLTASDSGDEESPNVRSTERPREGLGVLYSQLGQVINEGRENFLASIHAMHATASMEPPPPRLPSRLQLITPSASPPPPGRSYRMSDAVHGTKGQRVASTPRRTMSEAPSSSRSQIQDDVDKERQASTMRLLETWASLEQRYARPLDEDDIIDIQTGEIVRDNGFLRNSGKRDFGSFAASVDGGAAADDSSDVYEEEEDEYDDDELDLFADVNQEPAESESREQRIAEYLGGIRPPSSSFALDDLQEFLEAERRRKQIYGSDLDDDDEDDNTGYYSAEEARSDVVADSGSRSAYEEEGEEDEVVEAGEEEAENESAEVEAEEVEDDFTANSALLPDLPSEDELDNWDLGEASLVVPVVKDEPADNMEESDVEIELIENPEPPSTVLTAIGSRGKRNKSVQPHSEPLQEPSRRPPLRQLYTPPQSHDSTTPSSDNFIDLSVDSPPTKSSSKASKSSNKKTSIVNAVESSSKSPPTRSPEIPPAKPSPTRMHKLKPYVLLTPRKFLDKEKEHVGASPTKDVKRKGKAKEVDESRSETAVPDVDVERPSSRALPVGPPRGKSRRPQQESSRETRDSVAMPPPPPPKTPKQKKESTPSAKGVSKSQEPSPAKAQKSQTGDVFDKARHERPQRATSTIRQQTPSPRKRKRSMTPDVISSSTSRGSREANNATEPASPPSRASASKVQLDSSPASTSQSPTKKRRSSRGRQSRVESGSDSSDSEAEDVPRPGDRHPPVRGSSFPVPHPHYAYPFPPYYHPHHPPPEYPPYPNLQAQQIIQNAVQQLSAALLGSAWPPPPGFAPPPAQQTPSRGRHSSRRPDDPFTTPTHHPHPFPYIYDPTLSHATEPPESPEVDSSPEMSVSGRRKSLVRRSRSRGRRVSFVVEDEEMEIQSSPVGLQASRRAVRKQHQDNREAEARSPTPRAKGKQKATSSDSAYYSEGDEEEEVERPRRDYRRAQTPGPGAGSPPSRKEYQRAQTPGPNSSPSSPSKQGRSSDSRKRQA